jgi:hypothetical protein
VETGFDQDAAIHHFTLAIQTHGQVPPGVDVMREYRKAISYRHEETPSGGVVHVRATEARALQAVHDFLCYQIREHRTGDPLGHWP